MYICKYVATCIVTKICMYVVATLILYLYAYVYMYNIKQLPAIYVCMKLIWG